MPSATIIGGGPAGSVAAVLLARAGWEVRLYERHRAGRDKVCGECLAGLGLEVLTRLGLRRRIAALGPVELRRVSFAPAGISASGDGEVTIDLPNPMWGLSRRALDGALLDEARASGAEVEYGMRMEAIDASTVSVTCRRLEDNAMLTRRADYILMACGSGERGADSRSGEMGIKAHFLNVQRRATDGRDAKDAADGAGLGGISLFGFRGHYAGLAPIEHGRWNLAMSVPARRIREFGGDLDALLNAICGENALLAERMRTARRVGRWLASPLPRFALGRSRHERIIRIGNAAAAIEPVGGQGMALAMRSAEIVARHLMDQAQRCHDQRRDERDRACREDLARLWRRRRMICRGGAVVLSHPWLAHLAAPMARAIVPVALAAME